MPKNATTLKITHPDLQLTNSYAIFHWHEGGAGNKAVGQWPRNCINVFSIPTSPAMCAASEGIVFRASSCYCRG